MKAPVIGLLAATVAFAGSSVYLWQQVNEQRARADEVTELTRRLNARIAELEQARNDFSVPRMADGPGMSGEMALAHGRPGQPPPPAGVLEANEEGPINFPGPRGQRSESFQKMMRSQMRTMNKRMYEGLDEALGISQEEANKIIDLITDQRIKFFDKQRETNDPAEAHRVAEEMRKQNEAELIETLGTSKAQALEDYQKTVPSRQELEFLSQQMEGADATLTEDQNKRLLAALIDERARVPEPQRADADSSEAFVKAHDTWQDDYDQRVASQASSILNSNQLKAYNEFKDWGREMREQMQTRRAARGVRAGSAGDSVSFTQEVPAAGPTVTPAKPK